MHWERCPAKIDSCNHCFHRWSFVKCFITDAHLTEGRLKDNPGCSSYNSIVWEGQTKRDHNKMVSGCPCCFACVLVSYIQHFSQILEFDFDDQVPNVPKPVPCSISGCSGKVPSLFRCQWWWWLWCWSPSCIWLGGEALSETEAERLNTPQLAMLKRIVNYQSP